MTSKNALHLAGMLPVVLLKTALAIGLVLPAGCGKSALLSPGWLFPIECEIVGCQREYADSVTVALLDPVEPEHAPYPHNASEQILFRHLYQTLIRLDCLGDVRTDLAVSWNRKDGGRRWTFELVKDARFWDGTPLTARNVMNSWARSKKAEFCYDIDSTSVEGDRILHVYFRYPHKEVPRFLASGEFSVSKAAADSKWPLGSGPYQIVTSKREAEGMFKRTIIVYPHYNREGPMIRFVGASAFDARDLLESAVDVMVTSDPSVIDYALKQPMLETAALPWDRTYVLVSTSRFLEIRRGETFDAFSQSLSEELARDAVRNEARSFASPTWWEELDDCRDVDGIAAEAVEISWNGFSTSDMQRIVYDANDPVAQDLAERIIALALTDRNASESAAGLVDAVPGLGDDMQGMIAQGLDTWELAENLRRGSDFAYIISLPRRPADPCCGARALLERIPWLAEMGSELAQVFVPLVDTRQHVIAGSRGIALSADWFGNVFILNGVQPER